jgi:hypothetical protein
MAFSSLLMISALRSTTAGAGYYTVGLASQSSAAVVWQANRLLQKIETGYPERTVSIARETMEL